MYQFFYSRKIYFILFTAFFIVLNTLSIAYSEDAIVWDILNDGKKGIPEAIDALKSASGLNTKKHFKSCKEILQDNNSALSGTYIIDPDGINNDPPFEVYCDMSTAGGGWTLVAKSTGKETSKLTGDDKESWLEKKYFGSIGTLDEESAFGQPYHTVSLQDIMIRSINDPTKLLAWSHPTPISNLYFIIKSGTIKADGELIGGDIHTLDYRSGCEKGTIPKSIYYGIFVSDVQNLNNITSLGLFTTKGWLHAIIGWGSLSQDYSSGYNVAGGFGVKNYSGYLWTLTRHIHGIGNGCNPSEWSSSNYKGTQSLNAHALFIR
ncbi:membrane or secreted protein containing Fibrinogen, alpha/beta/gamma chain [Candidatus Magnetomorum sp. HK-1]|nr:membrane or secreted protein containing Fibrinogen, alpha/beta/gamma chain [Candidatus Magnetomorum sp. HK-1]